MALTRKQFLAINDLFDAGGDEAAVLEKHKIKLSLWLKWQKDKNFGDEISRRMAALERQGQILIAKYRPVAIAQLVQLCNNENNETSRKACIDMLNFVVNGQKPEQAEQEQTKLSPQTASKLLAALAEGAETEEIECG
jgi:hypothetical protein